MYLEVLYTFSVFPLYPLLFCVKLLLSNYGGSIFCLIIKLPPYTRLITILFIVITINIKNLFPDVNMIKYKSTATIVFQGTFGLVRR